MSIVIPSLDPLDLYKKNNNLTTPDDLTDSYDKFISTNIWLISLNSILLLILLGSELILKLCQRPHNRNTPETKAPTKFRRGAAALSLPFGAAAAILQLNQVLNIDEIVSLIKENTPYEYTASGIKANVNFFIWMYITLAISTFSTNTSAFCLGMILKQFRIPDNIRQQVENMYLTLKNVEQPAYPNDQDLLPELDTLLTQDTTSLREMINAISESLTRADEEIEPFQAQLSTNQKRLSWLCCCSRPINAADRAAQEERQPLLGIAVQNPVDEEEHNAERAAEAMAAAFNM